MSLTPPAAPFERVAPERASAFRGAPEREAPPPTEQGPSARECSHCGLSVPDALFDPTSEHNFCCSGCETVFRLLRGSGLEDYYAFRERLGESGRRVEAEAEDAYEFDSPAFQKLYCTTTPDGLCHTELLLEGVHCAACVWLVERLPRLEPCVSSARLDMSRASLALSWDAQQGSLGRITATLASLGYRPRPCRGQEAERMRRAELRSLLVRMGVAGACAGNVMLMAFALYSGSSGPDQAGTMDPQTTRFFELASLVVSLPSLWAGGLFFRGAWAALRTRTPHMDLPIALGICVAFGWGAFNALFGGGEIYFDSITALVFFLLIGRYLSRRHQMAESDALELLDAVVPGSATILGSEDEHLEIASSDVERGARVLLRSGCVVPVDGVVESGASALDKSLLSGESRPVDVRPGDVVEAGALNLGAPLVIRAERAGEKTRIGMLMRQVDQALSTRTPLIHRADRLAGVFTLVVISLAVFVFAFFAAQSVQTGIERALALLIVACPCALGLATPLSLSAAVHQAARSGQLVFSPAALERLAQPTDLVLDKTGTLTHGKLEVVRVEGDEALLSAAAVLERHARHPAAAAICAFARDRLDREVCVEQADEAVSRGVTGYLDGKRLVVGSPAFVTSEASSLATKLSWDHPPLQGASPVLIAWGGEVRTVVWLADRLRDDAVHTLLQLKKKGHRLHLLSGDHLPTVLQVADQLSRSSGEPELFESVHGGVDPTGKLERVEELKKAPSARRRPVVMVGDGVNDAAALAAADVGVAVSGATEASRLSADVYLLNASVGELFVLYSGCRRTLSTITRGIVFSLIYNATGIGLSALGLLGPLGAAVLMPLSSLTVVTNAYRSVTFFSERTKR